MGVNSLPNTVTRQLRNCELNPGPSAPESSTLTTRLSSHPVIIVGCVKSKPMTAMTAVSVGVTIGNMTGHLPPGLLSPRPTQRRRQLPRVTANSHRHARHDKTVLSVSRPRRRCELDSRQLKTVADRKSEVCMSTFRAIVQFTPQRQTRRRQDRLVVSGGGCELGIRVSSYRVSIGHRAFCAAVTSVWNTLLETVRSSSSLTTFRKY